MPNPKASKKKPSGKKKEPKKDTDKQPEGETKGRQGRNPLQFFMKPFAYTIDGKNYKNPGILRAILYPVLRKLYDTGDYNAEKDLFQAFRDTTNCVVSAATFRKWLRAMGISFKRRVVVEGFPEDGEAPADIPNTNPSNESEETEEDDSEEESDGDGEEGEEGDDEDWEDDSEEED